MCTSELMLAASTAGGIRAAACVGEHVMPTIVPGMNSLGDVINRFASMVKSGDPRIMTSAGLRRRRRAAWDTWKVAAGIYGLITAGAALNSAAAALTAAAVAQGAPGVAGKSAGRCRRRWLARCIWPRRRDQSARDPRPGAARNAWLHLRRAGGQPEEGARGAPGRSYVQRLTRFLLGDAADEGFSFRRSMGLDIEKYQSSAGAAKGSGVIEDMLAGMDKLNSTTASPTVDQKSIDAFLEKINAAKAALASLGSAVSSASSNIDAQLRRAQTDYGVAP